MLARRRRFIKRTKCSDLRKTRRILQIYRLKRRLLDRRRVGFVILE